VLGAVVPVYNLPEIDTPLKFTGPVLADIFLGKIEKWNDPALKHLNPGVDLPDRKMTVVHRFDSSGTTYVFSEYLSAVSPEWKKRVGRGKVVKWPAGLEENGNAGVAGTVSRITGAIGYLQQKAGQSDKLKFGLVENDEGKFVAATSASITAAFNNALSKIPDDLRFSIVNPPGKESFPICSAVWAVLYVNPSGDRARRAVDFLKWVLDEGQAFAEEMSYAPLPAELLKRAQKQLDRVRVDGGAF
jgi:phosphate transport system substrate-binding protein